MAFEADSTSTGAFDPYTQIFNLTLPDGSGMPVSVQDVDGYVKYGIRICINYSSQIGASLVLLVVLLILTRKDKRNTPIFALNVTALTFNLIRNILQCVYFTGPFYNFYIYFSGDYSRVPREQVGASIAGVVFTFFVLLCIETSLVMQVQAVCVLLKPTHKMLLSMASVAVALQAVGFRFALTVANGRAIRALQDFGNFEWLATTSNYATMGSVCFFSAVFVMKLGMALYGRRKMGIRQFGPLQIIFIMGCQTMVVPAIFSILQNFTSVPELGSQTMTLVAIFLPLSAMWASASVHETKSQLDTPARSKDSADSGRNKLLKSWPSASHTETSSDGKGDGRSHADDFLHLPTATKSEMDFN